MEFFKNLFGGKKGTEVEEIEEKELIYGGKPVYGENNGGENDWSGGGDYARFGTTPYGTCTRGANADITPAGMKMLCDSWAFVLGGFTVFGTVPRIVEISIWLYTGGRIAQEAEHH